MAFASGSLFRYLSADRFFLTVLRPEEILRDFEPSSRRRRHLRHRTLFSLSDTKIPILNICMQNATYFSDVGGLQSVHAVTLLVFEDLTVSVKAAPYEPRERLVRSNITQVSPRAVGQRTLVTSPYGGQGFCYPARHFSPTPILVGW